MTYLFWLVFIPVVLINFFIRRNRKKIYKPKIESGVQTPGKLETSITKLFMLLDALLLVFLMIGIIMGNSEMILVFGIITGSFVIMTFVLKYAQDVSYQETDTYFILRRGSDERKVYFKDINDWRPTQNEITIYDQTEKGNKPIRVSLLTFEPEILLYKLIELTFTGKLDRPDWTPKQNEKMRKELVNYLTRYQYDYLIEKYISKAEVKEE